MKPTKKSLIQQFTAPDVRVKAIVVGPKHTLTEWPALRQELMAIGWTEDAVDSFTGKLTDPRTNHFVMKPRLHRERIGRLTGRPSGGRYAFTWTDPTTIHEETSSGAVIDLRVSEDGEALELEMFAGNKIRYTMQSDQPTQEHTK